MRRFGKTESYKIKQVIFLGVLVVLAAIVWLSLSHQGAVVPGVLAVVALGIIIFLISRYDFLLTLKEYERAVIFRFGRVVRVGGPGWAFVTPLIESFRFVDLRTHTVDIPKQEVITNDKIVLSLDAVIYLYVKPDKESVIRSVIEIRDYEKAATSFVQATIRDVAGTLTFPELISNIAELNARVQKELEAIAREWGVSIEAAQISDIQIPQELEDALTHQKAAEQKKLARVELAAAHKIEIEAVRAAAEQLDDKSLAYYYIRALEKMGDGKSTKFFFPIELTRLAERLGSGAQQLTNDPKELEGLLKKYLPAIKAIASKPAP
ncbi:hypothetical protein KKE06_00725 [Candidatus Micrarchaeota archaeon]|nr:hypothetical protein [Candidatus Micrarchaeota archaeon]MBU1930130.1 hypothetical protein [Candidatus Micrarchaeota archaeon]